MIYYIKFNSGEKNTAGEKAPEDIYVLCKNRGYKKYEIPSYFPEHNSIPEMLRGFSHYMILWIRLLKLLKKRDILFCQHPMHGAPIEGLFLPLCRLKGVKVITLIHDLESLRHGVNSKQSPIKSSFTDGYVLKQSDVVICHNDAMKEHLLSCGFNKNRLLTLEVFDYLCSMHKKPAFQKSNQIVIAANLSKIKSNYIYYINDRIANNNIRLSLYGIQYYKDNPHKASIIYNGVFKPDELPAKLQGSFGLIWDGPSIHTCAGNTGQYLRYNNPHKLSLYLAAGIPVIVWEQAAIAKFVIEQGIGITVRNLINLDEVISKIDETQYRRMCEQAWTLSEKVRCGYFFYTAFDQAVAKCK